MKLWDCTFSVNHISTVWSDIQIDTKEVATLFKKSEISFYDVGVLNSEANNDSNLEYTNTIASICKSNNAYESGSLIIEDTYSYDLDLLSEYEDGYINSIRVNHKKGDIFEYLLYCDKILKKKYHVIPIFKDEDIINHFNVIENYIPSYKIIFIKSTNIEKLQKAISIAQKHRKSAIGLDIPEKFLFDNSILGLLDDIDFLSTTILGLSPKFQFPRTEAYVTHNNIKWIWIMADLFFDRNKIAFCKMKIKNALCEDQISVGEIDNSVCLCEAYEALINSSLEKNEIDRIVKKARNKKKNVLVVFLSSNTSIDNFIDAFINQIELRYFDFVFLDDRYENKEIRKDQEKIKKYGYSYFDLRSKKNNAIKAIRSYEHAIVLSTRMIPILFSIAKNIEIMTTINNSGVFFLGNVKKEKREFCRLSDFGSIISDSIVKIAEGNAIFLNSIILCDYLKDETCCSGDVVGSLKLGQSIFMSYKLNKISDFYVLTDHFSEYNVLRGKHVYSSKKSDTYCDLLYELNFIIKYWSKYYSNIDLTVMTALRTSSIHFLDSYGLMVFRSLGEYNYHSYYSHRDIIKCLPDYSLQKAFIISLIPKMVAKIIVRRPGGYFMSLATRVEKFFFKDKCIVNDDVIQLGRQIENAHYDKNCLCIAIPTANRDGVIDECLSNTIDMYYRLCVDVVIVDSSKDDKTENVVEKYINSGYSNVHYTRYEGVIDSKSIDQKVLDIYSQLYDKYQYIWIVRDRTKINFNIIFQKIKEAMKKSADFIVVHDRNARHPDSFVKYTNPLLFFEEQFSDMTVLGTTIVKSDTIREIIKREPLDELLNYSLWIPTAFFSYISEHEFLAYAYSESRVFEYHKSAFERGGGSFWLRFFLWQWGERLYEILMNLPDVYGGLRKKVLSEIIGQFNLYNAWFLIGARARGGLTLFNVIRYKKYLREVSESSMALIYKTLFVPRIIARFFVKYPDTLLLFCLRRNAELRDIMKAKNDVTLGLY